MTTSTAEPVTKTLDVPGATLTIGPDQARAAITRLQPAVVLVTLEPKPETIDALIDASRAASRRPAPRRAFLPGRSSSRMVFSGQRMKSKDAYSETTSSRPKYSAQDSAATSFRAFSVTASAVLRARAA